MKIAILFLLVVIILIVGIVNNVFASMPPRTGSQLELLFYTAPQALDWTSPTSLIRTTIQNSLSSVEGPRQIWDVQNPSALYEKLEIQEKERGVELYPHSISHVNVRIKCAGKSEKIVGSTGKQTTSEYLKKLLLEGAALETIVENTKGGLYTTAQVNRWLPTMRANGWVHSLRYEISDSLCSYVDQYLLTYEKSGQHFIYGGLHTEPLAGVGAGCSAFAMSVLRVAGLYERVFDQWFRRSLRIPHEIMNLPGAPSRYNFYDLFFGSYSRWASESESHMKINFWDPQLMYNWVTQLKNQQTFWWRDFQIQQIGQSFVVAVDARDVKSPTKPFQFSSSHLKRIQDEVRRLWN